MKVADRNARLAFKNSPPEKCVPKVVLPTPPKPKRVIATGV